MYKEIYPHIFLLEIPLRNNPLKALNCYIIKGEESLVIDTGFDTEENRDILLGALKDLSIDPKKTSLFLTHLHSDHTGLASYLAEEGVKVYMGAIDGKILMESAHEDSPHWMKIKRLAELQGLAPDHLNIQDHPGFRFRPKSVPQLHTTKEGHVFNIAEYRLKVIDLPGHTPGLQALYDEEKGLLFSGDHILMTITPNITYWGEETGDSLGTYLKNLELVNQMDLSQIFSSHRQLPENYRERIEELKVHHDHRLKESLEILKRNGASTVRQVTKELQWDIRAKDWNDFPSSQKWFAAGEAHAHLRHLEELGKVKSEEGEGILYFSLRE